MTSLHRRPAAPPQLVSASQIASTSNLEAQAARIGHGPSGSSRGRAKEGAYRGGRGGSLLIQKPRAWDGGHPRTAGGWSDGPAQRPSYMAQAGNGKGKEREQPQYSTNSASSAFAPGGRLPFGAALPPRPSYTASFSSFSSNLSTAAASSSYANTSARSAYGFPTRNTQAAAQPTPIPVPANPLPKVPRLYVSGLPVGVAEKEVREVFRRFGSIYDLTVTTPVALPRPSSSSFPAHITGAPDPSVPIPTHTFAHVTYETFLSAQSALAALDGTQFPSSAGGGRMSVEWSDPDRKRGAALVERRAPDEPRFAQAPPSEPRSMREQRENEAAATAARKRDEDQAEDVLKERRREDLFNRATVTPGLSQAGTLKTDGDEEDDEDAGEGSDEEVGRRLLVSNSTATSRTHSRTPSAVEVHHALHPSISRPSSIALTAQAIPHPESAHQQKEIKCTSSMDAHLAPGAKLKLPAHTSSAAASAHLLTMPLLTLSTPSGVTLRPNKRATYAGDSEWLVRWMSAGLRDVGGGGKKRKMRRATVPAENFLHEEGMEDAAMVQLETIGARVVSVEREQKGAILLARFVWTHQGPEHGAQIEAEEEQDREARQDELHEEQPEEDDPDAEIDQLRSDTDMDVDAPVPPRQPSPALRPPSPAPALVPATDSPVRHSTTSPSAPLVDPRPVVPHSTSTTFPQDETFHTLSIPLPPSCFGDSEEAVKARKSMRLAEVKRATADGKVVLESSWTDTALVLSYEEDEVMDDAGAEFVVRVAEEASPLDTRRPSSPPAPVVEPAPHASVEPTEQQDDVDMDDIKPSIESAQETPQSPDPAPRSPSPERPPVLFPLPINPPSAESRELEGHVEAFIKEYFSRFDSSRAMLEYLYTPYAIFSVKVLSRIPARLRHAPQPRPTPPYHAFPKRFTSAAGKVSATPTAIVNAITQLPTGSHDLSKIVYDAREIPELQARKGKAAPILLHLQAEFDEFPQHVVRSVYRTFVLVPKNASTGGQGCPLKYLIQSDQLVYGHFDSRSPGVLQQAVITRQTPPEPAPAPAAQAIPPPAPIPIGPVAAPAANPTTSPIAAPTIAQAAAPRPLSPPTRVTEKRPHSPPPAPAPPSEVHDEDVIVLSDSEDEQQDQQQEDRLAEPSTPVRPAKRLNRRSSIELELELTSPVPRPLPVQQPSSTSLGNRRAASPPPPRPHGLQATSSSSMTRRNSNQSASSHIASSSSDEDDADNSDNLDDQPAVSSATDAAPAQPVGTFLTPAQIEELIDRRIAAKAREEERKERKDKSKTEAKEKRRKEKEKERAKEKARAKKAVPLAPLEVGEAPGCSERGSATAIKDARIVIPGTTTSVLHGFNGSTNKMRYMVDTGDSLLGISLSGDLVEWDPSALGGSPRAGIHRVHRSTTDAYRVDDLAYSKSKGMVVVPYLGIKQDKTTSSPKHQIVLFKREKDAKTISKWTLLPLKQQPHLNCGITATTIVPGDKNSRLRFVTAGEDKSLFLWTRSRSKGEVTTDRIASAHTSMVTGLDYLAESGYVVSGAKDKRLFAYDLEHQRSIWSAVVPAAINGVQAVPMDSNLFVAKISTGHDQFHLFDLRVSSGNASMTFGFRLQPKKSTTNAAPVPPALGRYLRGSFRGMQYAHPDSESGVKLWDLRSLKDDGSPRQQALLGAGRSRVVQTMWRGAASGGGEESIALLELANFTSIKVR